MYLLLLLVVPIASMIEAIGVFYALLKPVKVFEVVKK